MTWLGVAPASRDSLKRLLKWGSVALTPGGEYVVGVVFVFFGAGCAEGWRGL